MDVTVVELGPLMVLLIAGTGAVSDSFTGFWNPTPHSGSPFRALTHEEMVSLITT